MARKPLTPKQAVFVQEYLVDLNGTQAAIRAGYSRNGAEVTGSRMLRNPRVRAAIDRGMAKRARKTEVSQAWVVERLVENTERALQKVPVTSEDGQEVGVWQYQGSVANQALGLLAKHTGGFSDKHDVNLTGEITMNFVQFNPDMLEKK